MSALSGKSLVVIGGTTGLGLSAARVFVEAGAFAHLASSPGRAPVVVWEANRAGAKVILAKALD